MTNPALDKRPTSRWLGRIVLILVIALIVWFMFPFGPRKAEPPVQSVTQSKGVTQSTEWAPEPTGPSAPVNLPKTPMTNVPDQSGTPVTKLPEKAP